MIQSCTYRNVIVNNVKKRAEFCEFVRRVSENQVEQNEMLKRRSDQKKLNSQGIFKNFFALSPDNSRDRNTYSNNELPKLMTPNV